MTDLSHVVATLPEREQILALRSVLHALDNEDLLPVPLQFCNKVSDLDAAWLILAVERGYTVVQQGAVWTDLRGDLRARMPHLTRIVNECLRLKLVRRRSREVMPDVWRVWLTAAQVHRDAGLNKPACGVTGQRFRLADDSRLIDCPACAGLDK